MPRALALRRTVVPREARDGFLAQARARRAYYTAARCRYWLFEDTGVAGAIIEFVEAPDGDTLAAAQAGSPDRAAADTGRIYEEIAL
jgi:hypothetical protein